MRQIINRVTQNPNVTKKKYTYWGKEPEAPSKTLKMMELQLKYRLRTVSNKLLVGLRYGTPTLTLTFTVV